MRDYVKNACEEIDAALFTGDSFFEKSAREELKAYILRWQRRLRELEKSAEREAAEEAANAAAKAAGKNWRSIAIWDYSLKLQDNTSTDEHETREQAETVCRMLKRDGLGGQGKHFPLHTRVEEIK